MAFGTLQNTGGEIDLVFFAKAWENCKALAAVEEILALKGTIEAGRPGFVVSSIQDLNKLVRQAAKIAAEIPFKEIHLRLAQGAAESETAILDLKNCIEENLKVLRLENSASKRKITLFIHVPSPLGAETIIRTEYNVKEGGKADALAKCASVAEMWGI
jgi:DNA polymerase-3 subunit alpha